ncbi:hypothetical protein K439DRAFT_1645153 [Ramaria rubella]|nr:hypothetical protein K439DRAFT_1645153 [Ramaria rubella]
MHLLTLNMGDLLIPLWHGQLQCADSDKVREWPQVVLVDSIWKEHGEKNASCRQNIPGSYDRPPCNIAEKVNTKYKAKEWQGYLYGLAPALLHNVLPKPYWQNFCTLVLGVQIIHQCSIRASDLQKAQQVLEEFHLEYEALYVQRWMDHLHFIRPCIHALLHLGLEHGLQRLQVNALKAMIPTTRLPKPYWQNFCTLGSLDLGDGYLLLRATEHYARLCEGIWGENWAVKITRWAHLQLPTGQTAHSLWKESLNPLAKLCRARCVKLFWKEHVEFAEVQFYFCTHINGKDYEHLLDESYGTVYSMTQMDDNGLQVIDVKTIRSVVSIQPHDYQVVPGDERFFVWEQMGLEMQRMSGHEESLEEED